MRLFKPRRPAPALNRAEALRCVPRKNPGVTVERIAADQVQLVYTVRLRPWFLALTRRLGGPAETERIKKLQLDELGTATWDLLDGQATVRQIVDRFAERYQLHRREAEVAVTRFLRELGRRGLIALQ